MSETPFREPGRRTPAKGVQVSLGGSNWVFLTVCTEKRERWLAQPAVQRALHEIWEHTATAWLVSDYLLMPDHLHLFCAPRDAQFTIERWIGFWKDRLAKNLKSQGGAALINLGGGAPPPYQIKTGRADLPVCPNQICPSPSAASGEAAPERPQAPHFKLGGAAAPPYQMYGKFQAGGFHHRLRDGESYVQKWQYVRENPVRAKLVVRPEDWPYGGRVHDLQWSAD